MKPISPRPILTLSILTAANQKSATKIPHVVAFSTQPSNHQWRRQEEESRAVRVSVWWDFENCHVPVNGNAFRVAQSITNAIRANGIKGPIEITAFGDVMQISRTNQEALSATGINLTHVPSGGKNSADRSLLVDLMYWVSKNPPPAHLLLISGDRDFAGILHRLRMSNYNVLLASPDSAPNVLCSAATIMWHWTSLLKGENLTGKLFNQPPDGPYNSWYGHYKAPLVDPFAVTEQSSCVSADESSLLASEPELLASEPELLASEPKLLTSEPKLRPIPKEVMRQISQILRSYPEGLLITQLRSELTKINLDKDLYGYRKFTRFLSAMPHILELYGGDRVVLAGRVNTKFSDELSPAVSEELGTKNGDGESGFCSDTGTNIEKSSCKDIAEKSTVGPVPAPKVKAELTNLHGYPKVEKQNESFVATKMQDVKMEARAANQRPSLPKREIQEEDRKVKLKNQPQKDEVAPTPLVVEVKDLSEKNENKMLVPDDCSSASGYGIFRRMWMKLFGSRDAKQDEALSGKDTVITTPCQSSEAVRPALFSPSSHEALVDGKIPQRDHATSDTSSQHSSSNKRSSWFKFFSSPKLEDKVEKNGETADQHPVNIKQLDEKKEEKNGETADQHQVNIKQLDEKKEEKNGEAAHVEVKSKQLEVFAKESFWKEMESFLNSSQSSAIFWKSRTRKFLAQNLQKQGPVVLRSLSISDILHLIDLLISDKKWVEERDFGKYPFRLTHPAGKCVQNSRPSSSNGLSHIFSERQPNLQDFNERKPQNHPHSGIPQPIVHRGSSSKPKSEVLADCRKLVDQIVKEYPEGFNVGGFKKLFLEKYGYTLDLQKLGHEKLATFLKIMPGAILESNLILPSGALKDSIQETKVGPVVDSHGDSSIVLMKDDDSDSSWDELGPVESSGSEKDETDARLAGKSRKGTEQRLHDYETLREDDLSDSEDEETPYTRSEDESKPKAAESALLDILDSWHSQKESAETDPELSTTTKNGSAAAAKPVRKPNSQKSYSFVKEAAPVDGNDKLIDGILGNLQKSGGKSADSQMLS